jgi:deoxyribose-phosphate aldolase
MVSQALAEFGNEGQGAESAAPLPTISATEAAGMIDHTLLKPEAVEAQIRQLCQEAKQYRFASVCVNPTWVAFCRALLADSPVKVCTVVGFPLGAGLAEVKAFEAERAVQAGAHELDMVINIGRLKGGDHQTVFQDVAAVVAVARRTGALVKAIIETALLTQDEKVAACVLAQAAGVDFVKTSTGFNGGGATAADVTLMRRVVGPNLGVKAAGGVRSALDLQMMVAAGATRIGASAGVKIVQELAANKKPAVPSAAGTQPGDSY